MKPALFLVVAFALIAVAGCGDDKGDGSAAKLRAQKPEALRSGKVTPADPRAGQAVALDSANSRKPAARRQLESLGVRSRGKGLLGSGPDAPEAEYDQFVAGVVPVIDSFWKEQTKKASAAADYEPPGRLVSYNLKASPGCGGDKSSDMSHNAYYCASLEDPAACRTPSKNKSYCSKGDVIAWDKEGLMLPFYREIGNLATALVLAHEWGHLAQARIFPQYAYRTTIRKELQADCFAGAWALDQQRKGRTSIGDFNQALGLFYKIGGGDQSWLDEGSHGNKFQRTRAFVQGFEEDVPGCVGEPFDKRLERLGLGREGVGSAPRGY